jgi:hypothetical protein
MEAEERRPRGSSAKRCGEKRTRFPGNITVLRLAILLNFKHAKLT